MPGEWGGERANVESTILLFDISTTTTPSEGDPLMIVVWGRSQPQCCHSGMHVKWAQQTHTAGLLQTWQLHDARGVRNQLPDTDVKVWRPSDQSAARATSTSDLHATVKISEQPIGREC